MLETSADKIDVTREPSFGEMWMAKRNARLLEMEGSG